jgi:hypothetical protein
VLTSRCNAECGLRNNTRVTVALMDVERLKSYSVDQE